MSSDAELAALVARLGPSLLARRARLATAESCTGGWIAKLITDVSGSSAWFEAGYVTYSNRSKTALLGVGQRLLEQHGAVSAEVVAAMADGARRRAMTDFAVAVSGVAGPTGGTPSKPVGTVWLGWASSRSISTRHELFAGDRETIRRRTVAAALEGLLEILADDAR